jgi:hypothetical protein
MAEKITHSSVVGGPIAIHTVDGVIRRIRPVVLQNDDARDGSSRPEARIYARPQGQTIVYRND